MTTLLGQPNLTIERCTVLNPATLLPTPADGNPHDCVAITDELTLPRPGLVDTPLSDADVEMFVDGSATKNVNGTNKVGYAVVTLQKVLKSETLPSHFSAQAAELIALTQACRLGKDKRVNIWTDSQYAFSTLFEPWDDNFYRQACDTQRLIIATLRCCSTSHQGCSL